MQTSRDPIGLDAKQLASGLRLELIEDGAISHFPPLSLLYDGQHAPSPSLARHLL
jgi:hypothetical protein